jgi:hypothetical protein
MDGLGTRFRLLSMSSNDEGIPKFMVAASTRSSTPPFNNQLPLDCSPVCYHGLSALYGNDRSDVRYLFAFTYLAPYSCEGSSGKAFIHEFLGSNVSADTGNKCGRKGERAYSRTSTVLRSGPARLRATGCKSEEEREEEKGKKKEKQVPPEDAFVSHLYAHPRRHVFFFFFFF